VRDAFAFPPEFGIEPRVTYFLPGTAGGIQLLRIKFVAIVTSLHCYMHIHSRFNTTHAVSQAADRVHRIGQQYPCKITFLQVKNSMDEALTQLQKNKRTQANLTLRGIGTVQGSGGGALGIRDVYTIMTALDGIYEPVIVANPEMFPEQLEKLRQLNKLVDSKRGTCVCLCLLSCDR
jgi:hypothetical protein